MRFWAAGSKRAVGKEKNGRTERAVETCVQENFHILGKRIGSWWHLVQNKDSR